MKSSGTCPKCQSKDIIADATVMDRGHANAPMEMSVAVFTDPQAVFFKGRKTSKVSAWVCGGCGFMELYVDHPKEIRLLPS